MDPASFSFAVITAFKEVYLLSKFVCNTLTSVSNYKSEQRELATEFFLEFTYTRSFGRLFLQGLGMNADDAQNTQWLNFLSVVLEKQRLLFGDFTKIALEIDSDYRKYSPIQNEQYASTKLIEFSLDENIPVVPSDSNRESWLPWMSKISFRSTFQKPVFRPEAWKWTLGQRNKLEILLRKYQKQNSRLKDVVPFLKTQHVISPTKSVQSGDLDDDLTITGLKPHLTLRQLIDKPTIPVTDLRIANLGLNAPARTNTLTVAEVSTAKASAKRKKRLLVEYKYYNRDEDVSDDPPQIGNEQSIHQLASLLASSGEFDLHTLPFKGYFEEQEEGRYAFLFAFPEGTSESEPVSLLNLIESKSASDRLNLPDRFKIAQIITKAIAGFHCDGWVHKSVRSKSIKFFHKDGVLQRHAPYLVDFEYSRPESAATALTYDMDDEKNIYRHPDRQGLPSVRFSRTHDVYALGVVLLEIGLWRTAASIYGDICGKMQKARPGAYVDPKACREVYLELSKKKLPHTMGPAYAQAVQACLEGEFNPSGIQTEDFKLLFHDTVIQNLDIRRLASPP